MTPDELRRLTSLTFQFIVQCDDGSILFAGPLPPPYGNGLSFEFSDDGCVLVSEEELDLWEDEWERFAADLRAGSLQLDVPIERRIQGDTSTCEPTKRKNKTRKQAEKAGAIITMPEYLAIPSRYPYEYALSTSQNPAAYLQPISQSAVFKMHFEKGTLYINDLRADIINLTQYYDKTPKAVSDLDSITLRALYTVILEDAMKDFKDPDRRKYMLNDEKYLDEHSVSLYIPAFLNMLGYRANTSKDMEKAALNIVMSYKSILGVMRGTKGGRTTSPDHYPVIQQSHYEESTKSISFISPYLNKLVVEILKSGIQKDKNGNPKLKSNGQPFMRPTHSFLVKSSIAKERNRRAAEIVCIVVTLIEQAGNGLPHISAKTIIDRCPDLKNALEAASSGNKSLILKRAFLKAWELLPKQTRLVEFYKNIKFPSTIPVASNLDIVFDFPHEGKIIKQLKLKNGD